MTFTAWSLFSGIGGLDLAFSWAGFAILLQAEIDPYCRAVLAKHAPRYWRNARRVEDVRDVKRGSAQTPDVLFGGFPCQDISGAGQQRGITPDSRSGLWYEFARIIGDVRPRVVFLENVANILRNDGTIVIGGLADMGYSAFWSPLQAADVGAPHFRKRWFCIAWRDVSDTDAIGQHLPRTDERLSNFVGDGETQIARRETGQLCAIGTGGQVLGNTNPFGLEGHDHLTSGSSAQIAARDGAGSHDRRTFESVSQSRLGGYVDGLPGGMDEHQFPAYANQAQKRGEPPRTRAYKGANWADRVGALGNAVVPQQALPYALTIRAFLQLIDEVQS